MHLARASATVFLAITLLGVSACADHQATEPDLGRTTDAGDAAVDSAAMVTARGDDAGPSSVNAEANHITSDLVRLDTVIFGDASSETKHQLAIAFFPVQAVVAPIPSHPSLGAASDVGPGWLGLAARRLLPRTPNPDYYGGEMTFVMAVDPAQQNYLTMKLAGGEASSSWLVLNVEGFEVGGRHQYGDGSANEMIFANSSGWLPGRFLYRTERIPQNLTQGKTSIHVKIRSLGTLSYYAGGDYDHAQQRMSAPTVGMYQGYTHLGPYLDPQGETQGQAPVFSNAGPPTAADETTMLSAWKSTVNSRVMQKLAAAPATLISDDVQFLAEAYGVSWTGAYQKPAVAAGVQAAIDAMVTAYSADAANYFSTSRLANAHWGGYLGPAGEAIRLLWPQLAGGMGVTFDYGGSIGAVTRQAAWSTALRASVDYGRFNRNSVTNQQLDAAFRTYAANRALLLVDAAHAISEPEAVRYLYEAAGIRPWLGNDQPGGGAEPVYGTAPYGPDWYAVTSRGTSKDGNVPYDCLVGGDYGELGSQVFDWWLRTNDAKILAQALKMLRVRAALRHAVADPHGHRIFYALEHIGCRNFQDVDLHIAYLGRAGMGDVAVASHGAAVVGADLMGYVQQEFNEGQLLQTLTGIVNGYSSGAAYLPDNYQAMRAQPESGIVLPMSPGQPDFAWADEENMTVAALQGNERFWAALRWRGPNGINRLARVYLETPTTSWLGEINDVEVQYNPSGETVAANGAVEGYAPWTPPDNPVNAEKDVVYPMALRPDLTSVPAINRDGGRGTGYTLRYGNWLVGINGHPSKNYALQVPLGFKSALDLISGEIKSAPVILSPKSAVVFRVEIAN